MKNKLLLLILLTFLSGCGTLDRALDLYESSVDQQNTEINVQEQILAERPDNLRVKKIADYDMLLSWDDAHADSYVVYRAWSYPQYESSYRRVGDTMDETYYVEGAYWSGIHYYAVRAVVDGVESELSSYVMFAPNK